MTGARISTEDWAYRYPGRAQPALQRVTVKVAAGELVVLVGASGSGKSTLLAALAGTLPPHGATGALRVEAAHVGLVQQEPEGNIVMETVGDDIAFPLENRAEELIWPRVTAIAAAVGLDIPMGSPTAALSGGQQQLLAVAAASVAGPDLLLLDEPTANLDPAAADLVLTAVRQVRRDTGCTVVVVEHRVAGWLDLADRVLLAIDGTVLSLQPDQLREFLHERPDAAGHVWLDGGAGAATPAGRPGAVVLSASDVSLEGRLAPVSLELRAGEVVALTGAPGAGKSTLLGCLAGLLTPTGGTVAVAQRTQPWRWPSREVAAVFGVVFQNPEHQFITGRVIDEMLHGLTGADARARAEAILQRLQLDHLADADPFTLSGGEQRRLSVATALVLDPRILVLDEPTFGQDPATWANLVGIIAAHRDAGGAVLMATHDPRLVTALGARDVRLTAAARPAAAPRIGPDRLRRLDPSALLGTAAALSMAALVSGSVALNLGLAALSLCAALLGGLGVRRTVLVAAPAALACVSVALSNALLSGYGLSSGQAWAAAALPASRVLALALPGLVAAVALDPTRFADALVVRLRVPARAAYAALAGLRLVPLLSQEWQVLGRANRARGLRSSGVPGFISMTFRLLVAALRRGGRLAIALEARGLQPGRAHRTVARPLRWSAADTLALLGGAAALVAAILT